MVKKTKNEPKSQAEKPAKKNGAGSGPLQELKELYEFMKTNGLQAFEFDKKDFHVKLVRKGSPTVPVPVPVAMAGAAGAQPAAAGAQPAAPAPAGPTLPPNSVMVKAPMMGIFYRAASPSSPPFAKEGDTVKPGDTLCLIEAMKVFNDIKAELSGVVHKVLIDNGKPVKVGQDMMIIERR